MSLGKQKDYVYNLTLVIANTYFVIEIKQSSSLFQVLVKLHER